MTLNCVLRSHGQFENNCLTKKALSILLSHYPHVCNAGEYFPVSDLNNFSLADAKLPCEPMRTHLQLYFNEYS